MSQKDSRFKAYLITSHFVSITALTFSMEARNSWIIDTGASHHITLDKGKSLLSDFKPMSSHVSFGDNSTSPIHGNGNCTICVGIQSIYLQNVLYLDIKKNLLSVTQLTKDNICLQLKDNLLIIRQLWPRFA